MDRPPAPALLALALAGPLLAGCTGPGEALAAPDVLATFYPLGWMAGRIAGPDLRVATLVPAGVEPHDWEPGPRELARAARAKVFVHNGAGLEPWAEAVAREVRAAGGRVVAATEGLPLHAAGDHAGDHDADGHAPDQESGHAAGHDTGHGADHGAAGAGEALDPHAWLDPVLARGMADNVLAAIQAADPANATAHAARAAALRADLEDLDRSFRGGLGDCARRDILTTHAAFGYLADRYGFVQHAVAGLSPEAEPSPAAIQEAVQLARRLNLSHVFFESLVSPRVAETIAREVGARTLVLNPLEGLTPAEQAAGLDFLGLARQNLAHLRTALGCA